MEVSRDTASIPIFSFTAQQKLKHSILFPAYLRFFFLFSTLENNNSNVRCIKNRTDPSNVLLCTMFGTIFNASYDMYL